MTTDQAAEARARVVAAALEWLWTPYHHHARVKGAGVDCANLLAAAYEAAGLVGPLELPFYPPEWHLHRSGELFLEFLQELGARPVRTFARGDMLVFRFGRTFSHGAIVVDERAGGVVHALYTAGKVVPGRLAEAPLAGREWQAWTMIEGDRP